MEMTLSQCCYKLGKKRGKRIKKKDWDIPTPFLKLEAKLFCFPNWIQWDKVLVWFRENSWKIIFILFLLNKFPSSIYFSLSLIFLHQLIQLEASCLRTFLLLFISWKIQVRRINWSYGRLVVWVHRLWLVENDSTILTICLLHHFRSYFIWMN